MELSIDIQARKMQEILLNVDNKEILNEILNYSIDYLIGAANKSSTIVKYEKNFEDAIRKISNYFKLYTLKRITETELLSKFSHMSQDLQQMVLLCVKARSAEIVDYLMREYNSLDNKLMVSFDWDVRVTLGDSNNPYLRTQTTSLELNCLKTELNGTSAESSFYFEMDKNKLDEFIKVLEQCDLQLNEMENC